MRTKIILSVVAGLALFAGAVVWLPGFRVPLQNLFASTTTPEASKDETSSGSPGDPDSETAKPAKLAPLPVLGIVVEPAPFILTVPASGRAQATRRVDLLARVSERIDHVYVREGDRVKAGQPLVDLDHRSLELSLREAEVALANAEVNARVQLLNDAEVTPEKEVLVANRSGLTAAQQSVARAELNLEGTRVTAPFDAYVVKVTAVLGGTAQPQSPLVTLVDLSTIRVYAEVLESSFGTLKPGIRAQVRFASLPGEIFEGTVAALSPEVDPSRGTGVAYIELSNLDGRIKPGMYAEVELFAAIYENRLAIPRGALLERDRRLLVFAAKNGRAEWQYVKTGLETDESIEITSGIAPGDTILVEGHLTLAHAAPVRVSLKK